MASGAAPAAGGIWGRLETSSIRIVDGSEAVRRELKAAREPGALATALMGLVGGLSVVPLEPRQLQAAARTMPLKTGSNQSAGHCPDGPPRSAGHIPCRKRMDRLLPIQGPGRRT
jgi:hypothetical protein